jgi:hypothetical protein
MVRRSTFNRDGESSILSSSTNDVVLPESSATSRDLRPLDSKPVQILPQSIGIVGARLPAAGGTEELPACFRQRSALTAHTENMGDLDPIECVHFSEAIASDEGSEFIICAGTVWITP